MNFILLFQLFQFASAQNLIIQVNHRYLDRCFEGLSEWITKYMQGNVIHGKFQERLRTGSIQATDVRTTHLYLRSASVEHHHAEHFVQIKGLNIKLKGNWRYRVLYLISDSSGFSLNINDMNVTLGSIVPEIFSGLPFIETDLSCKVRHGGFAFSLDQPKRFSNLLSKFMHRLMSGKIERTICAELTNALDMFLRNGIEQLSFRHSLTTGTILNNSLISKPLLSADGDLTTYHYGIVRGDSIPSTEITLLERYPYDVTYLVKPQLLDEILSTVYRRSLFDGSYKDDVEYNMSVECVKPPKVVLEGEGIILALEERLIAMKNAVLLLNDTFTVGLLLNALYSYRLQLFFQVLRTSNLAFLPEEVHQKFGSKLRQQWSSVVATYLRVPLPTAIGVLARNATLKIEKPFIVFGVDIYSPLYHNSKRSLS